jgi:hypothetical protein
MENSVEKLNYILNEISTITESNRYVKKAKKFKSDSYSEQINKLDLVSLEKVKKHSFVSEVMRYAEHLEKQRFLPILTKAVIKLERHLYAPELNCLHFKRKTINTPQKTTIADAINCIIQNNTISQLYNINLNL